MKRMVVGFLMLAAACSPAPTEPESAAPPAAAEPAAPAQAPPPVVLPAGDYTLDRSHSTVTFRVSHLGFSTFVATFDDIDASLKLDPANPSASSLSASVKPASLDLPAPPDGFLKDMLGESWFDAAKFPEITFVSTGIAVTGPDTAIVTGDLSMRGVTRPVTMDVVFNGGWEGIPPDPNARAGFSATGMLKRSDFGMSFGIPEPGSEMGVSDDVSFSIETEFSGPAWTQPVAPAPAQ